MLLIGAGLFVRTLQNLRVGRRRLQRRQHPDVPRQPGAQRLLARAHHAALQRMQSALEALPGVRSVSFTRTALLSGSTSITGIYRQGQTDKKAKDIYNMAVSPKFFDTMKIPIVLRPRLRRARRCQADARRRSSTRPRPGNTSPTRTPSANASASRSKRAARPRSSASSATPSTTACAMPRRRRSTADPAGHALADGDGAHGQRAGSLTETVRTAMQQVDPDVPMTGMTTQSEQVEAASRRNGCSRWPIRCSAGWRCCWPASACSA